MSASFTAASSQKIANASATITTLPFTFGCWVTIASAIGGASRAFFYLGNPATSDYFIGYQSTTGSALAIQSANSVVGGSANSGVSPTTGKWYYVLGRFINSTNRRISVLSWDGALTHVGDTTSGADPASAASRTTLGCRDLSTPDLFWDGSLAEFFLLNGDIQADGLQTQDALVRQLAYGGPFSVPYIAKDILDYRALRSSLGSDQDRPDEFVNSPKGRQTWVSSGGPTLSPHPPLPYWYARPTPVIRPRVPLWVPPPKPITRRRALFLR